ncbi:VanZ family protein (plasmid) [Clostridium estertheticum]|uniref:VanZ family protein n=1 Tax=Clostridium estertheticum TaxID=238834 RepID=UPI001C0BFAE0|nr:VanZ family protein [Clostridium estertheticum]MBU3217380.1 VanZ family protein [Clostridium estertheticum]WAG58156.1 VanZ family protein [Clostridium estertheticum]
MLVTVIKSISYEYICLIFFCFIFQIVMVKKEHKNGHRYSWKHFIWVYIFYIYLMLVFICTGVGTLYEFRLYGTAISLNQINLIPFSITSGGIMTHIANAIMFLPLGFLLPLIWEQFKSAGKVVYTGLLFSLAIELSQLLDRRTTDIDDLIMNTMGAFLGLVIFYLFEKLFKSKKEKQKDSLIRTKLSFLAYHEACFYLIFSFAGVFLLYKPFLF